MEAIVQSLVQQIQKLEAKLMLFPQSFPAQLRLNQQQLRDAISCKSKLKSEFSNE